MIIPDGAEAARPFLPTRDFEQSKAFYEALGFRKLLDSDVAILPSGPRRSCSIARLKRNWIITG